MKAELSEGQTYWFTKEEEREIQAHNAAFYQVRPEEELLRSRFRAPRKDEAFEMLSMIEIVDEMRADHAHLFRCYNYQRFGRTLQAAGLERIHTRQGNRYKIVRVA